ncbi:hypothetical protein GGE67_002419 [Rhizobium leucaenae]|nr:hypothetical protein [Rhizobium leucaenae]
MGLVARIQTNGQASLVHREPELKLKPSKFLDTIGWTKNQRMRRLAKTENMIENQGELAVLYGFRRSYGDGCDVIPSFRIFAKAMDRDMPKSWWSSPA